MAPEDRQAMSWDDSPLPYQSLDGEGCILYVNGPWERFSGYSAAEVVGRPYAELIPEDHLDEFAETFRIFMEQGFLDGRDCHFRRKDGVVRALSIHGRLERSVDGPISHCMIVDVTERVQAEQALAESEQRYRSLFTLAPNPIVVHDGSDVIFANEAAARFLGFDDAAALTGRSVAGLVHPDSRRPVALRVMRMMAEDWIAPLTEEHYVRSDGTEVVADTIAAPLMVDGKRVIHVVGIDTTARLRAESALRETEERFRRLFDAAADGVIVHDGERVILANAAAVSLFGYKNCDAMCGANVEDLLHPEYVPVVRERLRRFAAGEGPLPPVEVRLKRADGSDWEAESNSTSLMLDGQRVTQVTFRDLTERRRTERELAGYRTELERLVEERTRSLNRVRRELESVTAVIARTVELRDPYTAGHQRRVAELSVAIADELGWTTEELDDLFVAASIHDIGKVTVPAEILSKPGAFSRIEYELVKGHAEAGYQIISSAELGGPVAQIVHQHHERLDGSGYPRGLLGDRILPSARVLAVADVVEAMMSHRPYRPAIGMTSAMDEMRRGRGSLYDRNVVDTCISLMADGFEFTVSE